MKSPISKKGFTLIELLIVIAIIAVLALAFVPSLMKAPAKSRDTQRTTAITKIANFLTTQSLSGGELSASACISSADADIKTVGTIHKLINDNIADFGGVFPEDPKSDNVTTGSTPECTGKYGFINFASSKNYSAVVFARVENTEAGNVKCSGLLDASDPTLTPGKVPGTEKVGDVDTDVAVCFAALIQ